MGLIAKNGKILQEYEKIAIAIFEIIKISNSQKDRDYDTRTCRFATEYS